MPVTTLASSAATFIYALSALLSGAQNAVVQGPSARYSDSMTSANEYVQYNVTAPPVLFQKRFTSPEERIADLRARARGLVNLLTHPPALFGGERDRKLTSNGLSDYDHRNHDLQMAEAIFNKILTHTFRSNGSINPIPDEITYYDKETVATIYLDMNGNVTRCRLIEVIEPEDAERVLRMIAEKQKLIEKTTFRTMLTIITACQALEPKRVPQSNNLEVMTQRNPQISFSNNMSDYNMWSIISGILPGTKWCGLGDISTSYDDLGSDKNLDKCCRAHDHCPIKVKAFRSRYGLVNWSLYTKSHCECDSLLYDCLKKAATPTAEMLGNFYFNVLRVQCVDEEEQTMCAARDPVTNECKLWQPETRQPKRMQFKSVRRDF